jgi:peptide/nickel transport system substrate-binding protein
MLKRALELMDAAGYELRGTRLVDRKSGTQFGFEILVKERDDERLALLFSQSLQRAGIQARVRVVDPVQYEGRRLNYDFDMIKNVYDQSLSPGNEQAYYWGSAAADEPGTRNYMGIKALPWTR